MCVFFFCFFVYWTRLFIEVWVPLLAPVLFRRLLLFGIRDLENLLTSAERHQNKTSVSFYNFVCGSRRFFHKSYGPYSGNFQNSWM